MPSPVTIQGGTLNPETSLGWLVLGPDPDRCRSRRWVDEPKDGPRQVGQAGPYPAVLHLAVLASAEEGWHRAPQERSTSLTSSCPRMGLSRHYGSLTLPSAGVGAWRQRKASLASMRSCRLNQGFSKGERERATQSGASRPANAWARSQGLRFSLSAKASRSS